MTDENLMKVFARPNAQREMATEHCPGCGHSLTWRLVAEAIDDLGIVDRSVCCGGVGCHGWFLFSGIFNFDQVMCLHGRAPAVATGVRRAVPPDRMVFTLQGDGDMTGEGCSEIIHAAARGERITAIMCNNASLGETGGDLCPTTLVGQRTKTSPQGRELGLHGYPLQLAEMLVGMPGVSYVARGAISNPASVVKLKEMIRRAFEIQLSGEEGLTFVEVLSPCPSGWGITPIEALKFVAEELASFNPVDELKVPPLEKEKESLE